MTNQNSSCASYFLLGLTFLWLHFVAGGAQLYSWTALALGASSAAMVPALAQALLSGLPLLPLAWLWRDSRSRAIFQAWLWAAGYLLFLSPSRLLDPAQSQTLLLSQLLLSLLYLGLLWWGTKSSAASAQAAPVGLGLALALAGLVAYPWLIVGALGSWLDTLLALALGLVVGLIAGLIIGRSWLASLADQSGSRGWDIFIGGLVIGATLLVMASGLAFNGLQLMLMLALPALGWTVMALAYRTDGLNWRPSALLIGLVTASILALSDTDSLAVIAQDPALRWIFFAAAGSALLGWLLLAAALLLQPYLSSRLAVGSGGAVWLVGLGLYLSLGQPGFYGDRLFVVLTDQADVSSAATMADYDARRRFVYDTLVGHADQHQAGLQGLLDTLGVDYQPYYLVNALEVEGGLLVRLLLLTRSEVARVMPSPVLRPLPKTPAISTGQASPPDGPAWNLTDIGADRVWGELGVRGAGIVIGQSDSGVQADHPEFRDRYRGRTSGPDYNWLDPWAGEPAPVDYSGHGTHTLGSILGQTVGVAPEAEWFACANLRRNIGNPALYLDCMQFMLAPYPQGGDPFRQGDPTRSAHVLNNSWGCPQNHEGCDPASLRPAVEALRAAGIFVVASAGNDGPDCETVTDPLAIYDAVLSVGAVDRHGDLAIFSSAGPVQVDGSGRTKPDIVAPGVGVLSAYPGSSYSTASGTSMAGPHLVGVVALLWSANPALIGDIDRTEQILFETARPVAGSLGTPDPEEALGELVGEEQAEELLQEVDPAQLETQPPTTGTCLAQTDLSQRPNNVAGFGQVDAYAAVQRALAE